MGENSRFPGGVFTILSDAETWIKKYKLTGMLSAMPLNQGLFDWAVENGALNMKKEKFEEKSKDPIFIAACTTASLEHYHYENGVKD